MAKLKMQTSPPERTPLQEYLSGEITINEYLKALDKGSWGDHKRRAIERRAKKLFSELHQAE